MPYLFLGDFPRTYPQYLDADAGRTLHAEPGGVYSMTPAAGTHVLPVPPGDGLWGPPIEPQNAPQTLETSTGQDPPPAKTAKSSNAAQAAEGA